ncbi:MAG TPA: hypothetical protein VGG05_23410 [Pseudonocardiaceae bacterium]
MADEMAVTCVRCSRQRDQRVWTADALAWVAERDRGATRWLCPTCARAHARDIEAKLPLEYW